MSPATPSTGTYGWPRRRRVVAGARGAEHRYEILEPLTAIEATSPPARVGDHDQPPA